LLIFISVFPQKLDDRHESDYEIVSAISQGDAEADLLQARHFVAEVKAWLRREKWL
jgi:hypothetical protein